jgi:hypothetical protein
MSRHDDRTESLIAHEAANWISRAASSRSLITVTRAERSKRGPHLTVFVSVFPESEARSALAFLARSHKDFSDHLKEHTRLQPLPPIDFALEPEVR